MPPGWALTPGQTVPNVKACPAPINARPEVDPLTHYVIVREDLPPGAAAAQLVHAAGESSPGNLKAGTFAIVLSVPDEVTLLRLAERLLQAGLARHVVFESDPPYQGQAMAIGLQPARRSLLRPHLSNLPLYGRTKK
jgi:peptidyl-tRNA hydrolase